MAEPYVLLPGEQHRTIGPFRVLADAESGTQDLTLYEALLPPGSFSFSPAGSVHSFANPGTGVVRVLGLGAPATVLGMFAEREELLARLARGEAPSGSPTSTAGTPARFSARHCSNPSGGSDGRSVRRP